MTGNGNLSYDNFTLLMCLLIYIPVLMFAILHSVARYWQGYLGTELFAVTPLVSFATRQRLQFVSQNLCAALALRISWLSVKLLHLAPKPEPSMQSCHNYHTLLAACNRLSQLLFFTAFAGVITFWMEVLQRVSQQVSGVCYNEEVNEIMANSTLRRSVHQRIVQLPDGGNEGPRVPTGVMSPNVIQLLVNFWAYGLILVLLTVQWYTCDNDVYLVIYDGETACIAILYGLLCVGLFIHGRKVIFKLTSIHADGLSRKCSIIVVSCLTVFPVRTVLFLLQPVFRVKLTGLMFKLTYPWFFYPVPEIVPSVVLLYLMAPKPASTWSSEPLLDQVRVENFGSFHDAQTIDEFPNLVWV